MSDVNVTVLLNAMGSGDPQALDRLFPMVYDELLQRAARERRRLGGQATLNTTALVHEAYVKLARNPDGAYASRAHFYAVAAKAMRHIYLDHAKRKLAAKRGGGADHVALDAELDAASDPLPDMQVAHAEQVLALEDAMDRLAQDAPRQAQVVECRFFGGMNVDDTAAVLGISPATVKRDWTVAQIRLYRMLS